MTQQIYPGLYGDLAFGRAGENDAMQSVWLAGAFGLMCGAAGHDSGPARARGLLVVETSRARYEADALRAQVLFAENQAGLLWRIPDEGLSIADVWTLHEPSGVWCRSMRLCNGSNAPLHLRRCLGRFVFAPGRYEVYSQRSGWCDENQGAWRLLDHGAIALGCEGGRTCQGGTPYAVLRDSDSRAAIAFHVMPAGNWRIRVAAVTAGPGADSPPFAVVELGLADDRLDLVLAPGDCVDLPDILIQPVPQGEPHLAAPALHRYLLDERLIDAKPAAPVVYNTWFDAFEHLELARLREQLTAAKEVGCEVFVVDAGWYGAQQGDWGLQTGDWREKLDGAFHGQMRVFADEVRAAGLGFGLWMEPERIGPFAPVRQQHPEWFAPVAHGFARPRLEDAHAYDWLRAEIARLIETYDLAWIKIDFNHELGDDPAQTELHGYYQKWHRLLREMRERYPHVFLEGCASGGMRSDAWTVAQFDNHFLSDTVAPADVLRIYQGALLRLPPGRIGKWAALRNVGSAVPVYGAPLADTPPAVVVPGGAIWTPSSTCDIDFAARVALCGMFGLSGDLAGLTPEMKQRLRHHAQFYKQWREFIAGAVGRLLTPPAPRGDCAGWAAIQLQRPDQPASLLFVYRLDDINATRAFRLQGLDARRTYVVHDDDGSAVCEPASGAHLMRAGLAVSLPAKYSAAVLVIQEG